MSSQHRSKTAVGNWGRALGLLALTILLLGGNSAIRADDPPQLAVYSMNFDGTDFRKVAQAPDRHWHGAPSWSNDGKRLLFHAYLKDNKTADCHLFVVNDDGTGLKDLGAGSFATWTPDNKQIVFAVPEQHVDKDQPGVWIMNADGKGREWLFAGTAPRVSPDGSRLLYVSHHEGNQSIYVYDMLDGASKKVLQDPYQQRPGNATWSPDGKRVAFVDERTGKFELILIDPASLEKKPVTRLRGLLGGPAAWAPNAKIVIWVKEKDPGEPQRLHSLEPDNEESPAVLPHQGKGTLNFDPAWSPDGQRIAFVSDRPPTEE